MTGERSAVLLAEDYPLKRRHASEERMRKRDVRRGWVVGEKASMVPVMAKETESHVDKVHVGEG